MNQYNNTGKRGTLNYALIALLVIVLTAGTACIGILSNGFTDWGKAGNDEHSIQIPEPETGSATDENGNEMENGKVYPMPAKMLFSSPTPTMEPMSTGITLSAIIKPASAYNKAVDWAVSWVNPGSAFATGKNAADYLTAEATGDGALTATVNCIQSFGEQIKIRVTSRDNESAFAECVVDYARRLTSTKLNVTYAARPQQNFSFTDANQTLDLYPIINPQPWYQIYGPSACENEFVYTYSGNYTVNNEVLSTQLAIRASTELKNALNAQGLTSDCWDWYTFEKITFGDLIFRLGGAASMSNAGFLNVANYNKLLAAFGATASSDFELRITVNTRYGGPVVTTYNCHYSHASAGLAVEGVEINNDTLIV